MTPLDYDRPQGPPSGGASLGALAVRMFILGKWPSGENDEPRVTDGGIYNPRDVNNRAWVAARNGIPGHWIGTPSLHAYGRAFDASIRPYSSELGDEIALWFANRALHLGVQEIIWNGQRWSNVTMTWRPYNGRSSHVDHVHIGLNNWAAEHLTAFMLRDADSPTPITPLPAPLLEEEEEEMLTTVITGNRAAVFGRFSSGKVAHLGPAEYNHERNLKNEGKSNAYFIHENDDAAYERLRIESGTTWA